MMDISKVSIEIEGDYLCSFIYSGVLILVDSKFILSAYKWNDIIDLSLKGYNGLDKYFLENYFKNSSNSKIPKGFENLEFIIDQTRLNQCRATKKDIKVWPSDINIYKNRIYIASDEGVDAIDFSWRSGEIQEFDESKKIWDETAFNISTNSFYRLAIASGKDGVLAYIPQNKRVTQKDVSQLVNATCVDCDWQNDRLIANTIDGVNVIDFSSLPIKNSFLGPDTEYWDAVNTAKKENPNISILSFINGQKVMSSWHAGNKEFFLTEDLSITFRITENKDSSTEHPTGHNLIKLNDEEVLASRTASFGTVVENDSHLQILGSAGISRFEEDFVTWRVFPRAKNYANHLHLIRDEHASILSIETDQTEATENGFGFSVESLNFESPLA